MTPEIRAFEYALGLYSVLIGIAVADMAMSFHRLLRHRSTVVWDPLALAAALYALCMAVYMWFDLWGVRNVSATRHFLFYLALIALLFLLFLIAAASLPDEPRAGTDLHEYYAANRSYFWSLIALFQLMYVCFGFYFTGSMLARMPLTPAAALLSKMIAPFVLSMLLLVFKSRSAHYAGLALLFAVMLLHYAPLQIN